MTADAPRRVAFLVAGDPQTETGGFLYSRRMIAALGEAGALDTVIRLPDRFPRGDDEAIEIAGRAIAALPKAAVLIVDGLAFTALAPVLSRRRDLAVIALIHHPLCDETGLTRAERQAWFEAETVALATARHVIVSSETTRRRLADFGVEPARVSVVKPGIDPPGGRRRARRHRRRGVPLTLLSVANLIPRKGQDLLVKALKRSQRRPWQLLLVGPQRDAAFARRLRLLVCTLGLGQRVTLTGEVTPRRLAALYAGADLFVLPSHYEGFGIALVEAVAHGAPVLTTRAGAIEEAVPDGAAMFVRSGHVPSLADGLAKLLAADRRHLSALQRRAAAAAAECRHWAEAEAEFTAVVAQISGAA